MKKQRILIFSGFLGSGKTTTMIETAKVLSRQGIKAALITNDLGSNLVDTSLAGLQGIPVAEIPDGCFCHDVPQLAAMMDTLTEAEQPDIIFAEPVGSCVDLVRNTYQELNKNYAGKYELAPFTAVVDPVRYRSIYMGIGENRFNPPVTYMYQKQLEEAEILLLNKVDTLDATGEQAVLASLEENFPSALVIPVSAVTHAHYDRWTAAITQGQLSRIPALDIDWDYVMEAENTMGWYNKKNLVESGAPVDLNAFTHALMEEIRQVFIREQLEIAHLKILCANGKDYVKEALTGTARSIMISRQMAGPHAAGELNVNIRALTLPDNLEALMEAALASCAARFGLSIHGQQTQAFDSFAHAPEPVFVP